MEEIRKKISRVIDKIQKFYGMKVLFAVESGSRAWRFDSKDSDYDVRCVHVYNKDRYLEIDNVADNIEVPEELSEGLDIVSWDIKKFMRLMRKSNPSVCEWLNSDIIYVDSKWRKEFKDLFDMAYDSVAIMKHYQGMAKQNYHKYIDKNTQIELKKYVYVLRALGCYEWLKNERNAPPLDYKESMKYLPLDIQKRFVAAVELKQSSETNKGERDEVTDKWIENMLKEEIKGETMIAFSTGYMNKLVKEVVEEYG